MTEVSVVMPVYNGAEHLDRALASLSSQSFPSLQIIISDNASTDATPEIIERWKARDSRIVSHRQAQNIGAIPNFKWVLAQADTPYAMFACHDDAWSPNYVEELFRMLKASPQLALAAPQMVLVRPDDSHDPRTFDEAVNEARGLSRAFRSIRRVHSGWFYGLYRREALVETWNVAQSFPYAWGGEFIGLLPLLAAGQVGGSNAAVYYKQETPLSAARYRPKNLRDQFVFYCRFLQKCLVILRVAGIPPSHKLALMPLMLLYTGRHGWKFRRLVVSALGLKKY